MQELCAKLTQYCYQLHNQVDFYYKTVIALEINIDEEQYASMDPEEKSLFISEF